MKKILVFAFALICFGCGGAPSDESATEQSQELSPATFYLAINGFINLPTNTIQKNICHPTLISGSGANSQSVILPGNVPECGGLVGINSTTVNAYPNSCKPIQSQQGTMLLTTRCEPLSNFGPVTTGSTTQSLAWNGTGSLEYVEQGVQVAPLAPTFNTRNACYLSGAGSMSVGNEYTWLAYDSTHAWLNAVGFKGLSASARCSRLGRPGGPVQTIQAWPGSPATGIPTSSGICLITQINGSIDDGSVTLSPGTNWVLSITGLVGYARAECYTYQ
jgi:hypothetical protein